MNANINLPFIAMAKDGPHHMDINISRQTFDMLTADLVERTVTPVENALHDAGLSKSDIGMVLLVGGSTRIPAVQNKVRLLMGREPSRNLNPDECVALGAAVQGGKLGGQLTAGSAASEIILILRRHNSEVRTGSFSVCYGSSALERPWYCLRWLCCLLRASETGCHLFHFQ